MENNEPGDYLLHPSQDRKGYVIAMKINNNEVPTRNFEIDDNGKIKTLEPKESYDTFEVFKKFF